tara:strand:+ start:37 stop:594 length:558 start_codon:yes stop_codon:yes gene_type:complete
MKEIWKDIKDYEGIYQVSNTGKIKSLEREVYHSRHGTINLKEKLKQFTKHKDGRFQVTLSFEGVNKMKMVSNLVAEHFKSTTEIRDCIIHLDKNNSNNNVDNLKYVTRRDVAFIRESKSKYKTSKKFGVWFEKSKNRYRASITMKGKQKTLGTFKTEKEASEAYKKAYILNDSFKETVYELSDSL